MLGIRERLGENELVESRAMEERIDGQGFAVAAGMFNC